MINFFNVKTNIFDIEGKIAELYNTSGKIPHLIGKAMIKPFHEEMKKDVNNIILFLDANNNITGGQIGKYNYDKGLHCIEF